MQKEIEYGDELFNLFICSQFTAEEGLNEHLTTHRSDHVASETEQNKTKTTTVQPYEPSAGHIVSLQEKETSAENLDGTSLQMAKVCMNQYSFNESYKTLTDSDFPTSHNLEHRELEIPNLKDPVVSEKNRNVEQQLCRRCQKSLTNLDRVLDHKETQANLMNSTDASRLLPTETGGVPHSTFTDINNLVSYKEQQTFLEVGHKEKHADVMESTSRSKVLPTETHDMRHETFGDLNNSVSLKEQRVFLENEDSISDRIKTEKPDLFEDTSILVNQKLFLHAHCENLNYHVPTNSREKPFQSDKTFTQKSSVIQHPRINSGEKPFQCDQCDKAFTSKSLLNRHIRMHTGEKPFKCDQCDKAFTQKCTLVVHLRTHSGEKPFKCDQCDKAFSQKYDSVLHLRAHTGEKPFKCDQCDKAFTSKGNLTKHIRIHSGGRPYGCELCDKTFVQKAYLTAHLRIHSGAKLFQCVQCDKTFTQKSYLNLHHIMGLCTVQTVKSHLIIPCP